MVTVHVPRRPGGGRRNIRSAVPSKTVRQTFWSSAENNYDAFGRLLRSHAVSRPGRRRRWP